MLLTKTENLWWCSFLDFGRVEIQITGLTQMVVLNCIYGDRLVNSPKGWESIPKFAGCASGISLNYEENALKRI